MDASRTATITPNNKVINRLKARLGDALTQDLGLDANALTAAEAGHFANFRDADSLRTRIATAKRERPERLRAKGVSQEVGLLFSRQKPPPGTTQQLPLGITRIIAGK